MVVEFGFFSLLTGFVFSLYAFIVSLVSFNKSNVNYINSARNALYVVTLCVYISSTILFISFLTHDFSVAYVYKNSAIDMPLIYVFTAFWSSLEGSHLLWTTLISSMITLALSTLRFRNKQLLPGLVFAFSLVSLFMMLLNVWASAPLTRLFPEGNFGLGMNPLLQNPYMAAHPPSLFAGYSALIVPFAYSISALILGRFTPEWFISVRRWLISAWAILTIGIFLGGKWAYVELGWAGYWAWDPVENSSFMPWLAATSAIHSLIILEKIGRLPRLTLVLLTAAFSLTFLGTFITRSGVISSVHSFAESNIGPAYLIFISLLLLVSSGLISFKGHLFTSQQASKKWTLSKESSLLFTNFFLIFMLVLVLVGTLLPLVIEAINGVRLSIQQPFYNAFAPWVGLGLVGILGIGNLLKWHRGDIVDPLTNLGIPALWSLIIGTSLSLKKELDIRSILCLYIILWSCCVLIMGFLNRLKDARWNGLALFNFQRSYLGSFITHLGFLLAVLGFLGNYRAVDAEANLKREESTEFFGYVFQNKGLTFEEGSNVKLVGAQIKVHPIENPNNTMFIRPIRSQFSNKEEWLNEIGVHSSFWFDIYLVLTHFDVNTQNVHLKIHINPTVKLVWTSLLVMILGALVSLSHKYKMKNVLQSHKSNNLSVLNSKDAENVLTTSFSSKLFSFAMILFVASCFIFGFSGVAFGEANIKSSSSIILLDPRLKDIGEELRCPTCQGVSMLESATPQSQAMKNEIEKQLKEGKTKQEILNFFEKRYGQWILRKPSLHSSVGFWFWVIPGLGLIIGPLSILYYIKHTQKKAKLDEKNLRTIIKNYVELRKTLKKEH